MEKEIKRADGTRYRIAVRPYMPTTGDTIIEYRVRVYKCEAGKRKFTALLNTDDHDYRRQPFPHGRNAYEMDLYLQHVTADEIHNARLEAWEELKP